MPETPALYLQNIQKSFGTFRALCDLDLSVEAGSFVAIVGPSGCGKSTLLRIIAGLETVSGGDIYLDGENVTDASAGERGLAMVFQSYALYPHKTVRQNMAFALKIEKRPKAEIERRVAEAARALQLEQHLDRYPRQLSGGQRQRVAIGRAIVRQPSVFLFDEPLSNLDASLRAETRVELAELHARLKATMIYVTHDQVEAMTLADKIVILKDGRIQQVGAPKDLYERPANVFVAGFIGSPKMNFIDGSVRGGTFASADLTVPLPGEFADGPATLGVRPEALEVARDGAGVGQMQVSIAEYLGDESVIHGRLADGTHLTLREKGSIDAAKGETLALALEDGAAIHLFGAENGLRIDPK
ncbi:sn-glycerol-3-phosphate ABC transporter ATP-binding protein UgpC [Acuticoccus sp. MNP-M23]|uniref:ABC transporter ATP-binding protein n=1 Tax=Acuticoccus sp. MNP-M23 TaxID=3072793 RepID=UPI0028151CDF|nr:sn-glycerol-3-phosphate ABC transporter ATP-binding protein UgpC [Acuticoccus sp. MNP-M23]WMS44011.1 sn-glycerol-3-phosphate ABC transporter ATP-binding protein UgpC [Acuticoccus sp. MNP-M23]